MASLRAVGNRFKAIKEMVTSSYLCALEEISI